ncbi:MAG: acyltransferase family protein [Candidatus Pelagibacter sp.]
MRIVYRPEIDGLRAIAVVAVILYHAKIIIFGYQPFKGGFIGVDIFFVISGYLITSIILKELVSTGSFSFVHFYKRRIRRILPALLFVMLVSLPFAWIYLLPESFVEFSKSILSSLGFGSNFYFHYVGQEYGAESSLLKPFLHTWSLSIEEQYYILFPFTFFLFFKYFRKQIVIILILVFFISLLMADWGSRNYPSLSFYVLPTRGWELILGSIIAYFEIQLGHRNKNEILSLILPSVGLFLILHSIIFFNDKILHPSFYTLSPVIGVCLIIWFSDKDEAFTKILSSKLFVRIGLISYSLYLWHYPIFAFARITEFASGNIFKKIILGFITIIISIISYYFIEKPARYKKYKFKLIFFWILITSIVLIALCSLIVINNGYNSRLSLVLQKSLTQQPWALLRDNKNNLCHDNEKSCIFNSSSKKKVFIIGDSHMSSLSFDLKEKITEKDYQFITFTLADCIYYPGFDLIELNIRKIDETCNSHYFSKLEKKLKEQKDSIIIFGGRFPLHLRNYYFDNKEGGIEGVSWGKRYVSNGKFENIQFSFSSSIQELSKNNKIILLYPIPEVGVHVPRKIFISRYIEEYFSTSFQIYKDRTESSFEMLDKIYGKNIYRVYPHKLFCDTLLKDRCIVNDNKNIFYADQHHPSIKGSEIINELIIKEIENIEKTVY